MEGYCSRTHLLITVHKISRPLSAVSCQIPREMSVMSCFRPVCVSFLVLPVLCAAAPGWPAPTPATGIWYSPHGRVGGSRVGGVHGFRLTENHGKGNGRETWVEIALVKVSILKEQKNLPQFWEGRAKETLSETKRRNQAEGNSREDSIKGVKQQAQELHGILFPQFTSRGVSSFGSLQFRRCLWFFLSVITSEGDFFLDRVALW